MNTTEPIRIAISGAAGRVGYSLAFRIANGGLFGHDHPVALSLLDLPEARPWLEACAMELKDSFFHSSPAFESVATRARLRGRRLDHSAGG